MRFLATCLLLLGSLWGQEAMAWDFKVGNEKKKVFIVTVSKKPARPTPLTSAYPIFCRPEGASLTGCFGDRRYPVFKRHQTYYPGKRNEGRPYSVEMRFGNFKSPPGRYYLTLLHFEDNVDISKATYFGDFAQGSVVVFSLSDLSSKEAIAYAKDHLIRWAGAKMGDLTYIAGGAVSLDCPEPWSKCQILKKIPVNSFHYSYQIERRRRY